MIPFNKPWVGGSELGYIEEAIRSYHLSGCGGFTKKCEGLLEEMTGVGRALLTTSCTHALEMSAHLLDIATDDEVILPSFTFVSTANAFILRGARPRFVDIRPDTLNIDETRIEGAITEQTKMIVPVHYAGVGCDMKALMAIARSHSLHVVEDNAHGLCGSYAGKKLGSIGSLATLSFHETKNFSCGEGGALLINNPQLIERAEIIREKGTDRSKFFRGEVDKYTWVDIGSSYPPSEILAAFLFAQLSSAKEIQRKRELIWSCYKNKLRDWAHERNVRLPIIPKECDQAYHLFYLLMPDEAARDALIRHLRDHKIQGVFHYLPLHLSPMGRSYGYRPGDLPVTEDLSIRLVRLPLFNAMTPEEQNHILSTVRSFQR